MSHYPIKELDQVLTVIRNAEAEIYKISGIPVRLRMVSAQHPTSLSVEDIMESVGVVTGVTAATIISKNRERNVADARFIVIALCRYYNPRISSLALGKALQRDHTSVLWALAQHEGYYKTDDIYRALYDQSKATVESCLLKSFQ